MSEDLVDGQALDAGWRERVQDVGRRNFEIEEMLRLGFLTEEDLERVEIRQLRMESYREAVARLSEAHQNLRALDRRLAQLQDAEHLIGEIRARRIERVKEERRIRTVEREEQEQLRRQAAAQRRRNEPTYLGPRVSRHLRFAGGDPEALERRGLPQLSTFLEVASALGLSPERLQWLVFERTADPVDHYTRFQIPKRSGGMRLISSPKPTLREAQQWIRSHVLQAQPVSTAAMAFRPGLSIADNARLHTGSALVVRMDLADFFPSISLIRVSRLFESLGYNPGVASVLALLCTDAPRVRATLDGQSSWVVTGERGLPQGACTSPDLANLISRRLDERLLGLSRRVGWRYSRYADDLVFSCDSGESNVGGLLGSVTRIVTDEGFTVNAAKTRIMRAPGRQLVTGLVVDDSVRVTRTMKRRIRAFLHRCERDGAAKVSEEIGRDAHAVARGYLAFVHMVDPEGAQRLRDECTWAF
jgi:hypothetical protein